ncbi:MAG: hypothetical protein QW392_09565 [Candidatus Jordarchaeales archaeon]
MFFEHPAVKILSKYEVYKLPVEPLLYTANIIWMRSKHGET